MFCVPLWGVTVLCGVVTGDGTTAATVAARPRRWATGGRWGSDDWESGALGGKGIFTGATCHRSCLRPRRRTHTADTLARLRPLVRRPFYSALAHTHPHTHIHTHRHTHSRTLRNAYYVYYYIYMYVYTLVYNDIRVGWWWSL